MRFKRWPRFVFEDTPRKRAALRRKQQKERDAFPLLAEQIAESQPSEDEVMLARAAAWEQQEIRDRNRRARKWKEARSRIASFSSNEAAVLRHAWNCAPYPADPVYLLDFLHRYSVGRFTLDTLPFDLARTDPHGRRQCIRETSEACDG
ncbi:hypothetical protein [Ruegeria sp. HKCCD8929]|uniref:hypothetical protein n=1 Tax=Ruegeria sp. HKCCD8929 TaxID=2683006 RepID=UPI0014883619|nr:hypothetical protein [Ruegeria sp. HKCCD8929]